MRRHIRRVGLAVAGTALLALGQAPAPPAPDILRLEFPPEANEERPPVRTLTVPLVAAGATVDGALTEACWRQAARSGDFRTRAGAAAGPGQGAEVRLAWSADALWLGLTADLPPPAEPEAEGAPPLSAVDILFDSSHDEASFQGIRVLSDGRWGAFASDPEANRLGAATVASRVEGRTWTVEAGVPFHLFTDPANGIWGFNVVRTGPREASAWNVAPAGASVASGFGHIAFQTQPYAVRAARLGQMHRGKNTLAVALVNAATADAEVEAVVVVAPPRGEPVRTPYRLTLPARQATWFAFDFALSDVGRHDLAFGVLDPQTKKPVCGFTRRGLDVPPIVTFGAAQHDGGEVVVPVRLAVSDEALPTVRLEASVRAPGAGRPAAFVRATRPASANGTVRCAVAGFEPGTYLLRVTARTADGTDTASVSFEVPPRR